MKLIIDVLKVPCENPVIINTIGGINLDDLNVIQNDLNAWESSDCVEFSDGNGIYRFICSFEPSQWEGNIKTIEAYWLLKQIDFEKIEMNDYDTEI